MNAATEINRDRRIGRSLQDWAQILALLINFGGLVWFAANINASVSNLQAITARQNTFLDKLNDKVAAHDVAIAVINSQMMIKK